MQRLRTHADRIVAVVVVVLGVAVLALGWFGVSGTGLTSEQMPYIVSGGLGGICLVAIGSALWLSADLRDEWTKLDRIEHVLRDHWAATHLNEGADGVTVAAPPMAAAAPAVDDVDTTRVADGYANFVDDAATREMAAASPSNGAGRSRDIA